MTSRLLAAALAFSAFLVPMAAISQTVQSTVSGRILEISAGLPVAGAKVELQIGGKDVASGTTGPDGSFSISNVPPAEYTVVISAAGYETLTSSVVVVQGESVQFQTAMAASVAGLRTIASVVSSARGTLQTSATINSNLNPAVLQDQNYIRAGDALTTLPFVSTSTSSALGDDESLSLRGFDSTESVTLLDGHPLGPIGAHGNAYDFQLAQFWGIGNVSVIYGSGASGLYAVPSMAGAVNFETLNPTQQQHFALTQGYGDLGHQLTGMSVTGTAGRIGYAAAYGVEGTDGELGGVIPQSNLLNTGQSRCAGSPSSAVYTPLINAAVSTGGSFNGNSLPPSILPGDVAACTYNVTGDYLNRNFVGKIVGNIASRTQLQATVYDASMWADSTGNGDTDFEPYPVQLAAAQGAVSGGAVNFELPNTTNTNCAGSTLAVLSSASSGYSCLTPQQYAQAFSGPSGGGLDRYHAAQNQDYDLRLTQGVGPGSLVLDGYVDNYTFVNQKGPLNGYVQANSFLDDYFTHGGVIQYEISRGKNDVTLGYSSLHQLYQNNSGATYVTSPIGWSTAPGSASPPTVAFGGFDQSDEISQNSYFVHDAWTPNNRFSVFADFDAHRSFNTATTNFDPRLSLVYHPTSNDVWRITGGRATSEPDPSLLTGGISAFPPLPSSDPSFNPANTCGTSGLVSLTGGASALTKPESSNDLELALAHRFQNQATVEVDAYNTTELNPIISGVFPLSTVPAGQLPPASFFQSYATELNTICGVTTFTPNSFGVSIPFNSGRAIYTGLNIQTKIPIVRGLEIDGNYAAQAARYQNVQDQILLTNGGLLNNYQFYGVPVNTANAGVGYSSAPGAWSARFEEHFVSSNNGLNRPAYSYATANISKTVGPITFNLGIYNVFNQDSGQFGLIGYGTQGYYNQFNPPGTAPFQSNNEEYFLPVRQYWMTTTIRF